MRCTAALTTVPSSAANSLRATALALSGFLCTTRENSEQLSEQAIKRGVYQLLVLESGFVTEQAREAVDELIKEYYVPLEHALYAQ